MPSERIEPPFNGCGYPFGYDEHDGDPHFCVLEPNHPAATAHRCDCGAERAIEPPSDIQIWNEAIAVRDAHDPEKQPDNGYHRCALCHYTRHPCDAYDMADTVIQLMERLQNADIEVMTRRLTDD